MSAKVKELIEEIKSKKKNGVIFSFEEIMDLMEAGIEWEDFLRAGFDDAEMELYMLEMGFPTRKAGHS